MSALSFGKGLRSGSSLLALSTVAMFAALPAHATDGIFGGGSTLASLAARQVGDCYRGSIVTGDGYNFSSAFNSVTPTPGLLPTTCTTPTHNLLELYAGVGSGAGLRGFVSNDPQQFFRGSVNTGTAAQSVQLPADPPKFLESAGPAPFNSYPYPRLDFGAGDSPLPSNLVTTSGTYGTFVYNATPSANWQSAASVTVTRADTTSTVAYSAASFGQPIQLPLFEAPVVVAVNLPAVDQATGKTTFTVGSTTVTWTINSQFSTTAPGGRIQLSTAQVCAIFSGLVTNWDDNTLIPRLKSDGTTSTQRFYADNTYHAASSAGAPGTGAARYVAKSDGTHLPITIVYRSDGSGTSYIFTNYLKTVCPLLDPTDKYGYQSIYATSSLPNNSFTQLINKVTAYGRTLNAIGASGSDAVATGIGNSAADYGRIGYLSNDFVAPYNPVTTTRPHAASLQNDYLRSKAVYHPGESLSGVPKDFVAATPTSADSAWQALAFYGVTPSTSWNYNDYNIYAKSFPATTYLAGSGTKVNITGLSILPLANRSTAFPIVGTAYGYFYSCYGVGRDSVSAATRVGNLKSYLKWYYTNAQASRILSNNGFHSITSSWVTNLTNEYLGTQSTAISAYNPLSKVRGCTGVSGGAK